MPDHLLILGASARAAAFSALRAGLRPWCVDLFADADLQARCPARRLAARDYPQGFVQAAASAPVGPWIYTGGLENRPALVTDLARGRTLWGNDAPALARVRSPFALQRLLRAAKVPCPAARQPAAGLPGCWLLKPLSGAGGTGIRVWTGRATPPPRKQQVYLQEYIEGEAWAAVYLGDGEQARLLGVTRQLVGEAWLRARPFHYCGSVGPLAPSPQLQHALEHLGSGVAGGSRLRGIFGIDCVVRDYVPWPVEVNPRYTASVEVLEHTLGIPALAWHRQVFESTVPAPPPAERATGVIVGKAVLFARAPLTFPADGPWLRVLHQPAAIHDLPAFADIPHVGQQIPRGRPVLTLFARDATEAGCLDRLKQIAADLDRWLFGP